MKKFILKLFHCKRYVHLFQHHCKRYVHLFQHDNLFPCLHCENYLSWEHWEKSCFMKVISLWDIAFSQVLNQPQAGMQWRTVWQHLRAVGRKPYVSAHFLVVVSWLFMRSYEYSWDSRKEVRTYVRFSTNRTQVLSNRTSRHAILRLVNLCYFTGRTARII